MKFTIITPVYNGEKYISETIESILSQEGLFEIEYIIQDGQSTDNTLAIIKSYQEKLRSNIIPIKCSGITLECYSEKDDGMYDAINKGLDRATGDIYAWINSDDFYLPGAFSFIANSFKKYLEISWLKGSVLLKNESSNSKEKIPSYIYNQDWITRGFYGTVAPFIVQEGVFWRPHLWKQAGGIDKTLKLAGDFYLWMQFAKHAPLWSINADLSCFRTSPTQLSHDMSPYRAEQKKILPHKDLLYYVVGIFFEIKRKTKKYPQLAVFLYRILFRNRNREIIDINQNKELNIRTIDSYIIEK